MVRYALRGLGKVVVRFVDALLIAVGCLYGHGGGLLREGAQRGGMLRVVCDNFGHDIFGALQGRFGRGEPPFGIDECGGRFKSAFPCSRLSENEVGQWFESRFARFRRAGRPLLLERLIQVFHTLHNGGTFDGCAQFFGKFSLLFDGIEDFGLARFQVTKVRQALLEGSKLRIVQPSCGLFAVSGDEGNGAAFVHQLDDGFDLCGGDGKLLRDGAVDVQHICSGFS